MKKNVFSSLVYSTNKELMQEPEVDVPDTLPAHLQKLHVKLDTKQRAGKIVTLVSGFIGHANDLETLAKTLKTHCGTGGSAKDGEIIIQGDYKIKVTTLLQKLHYTIK